MCAPPTGLPVLLPPPSSMRAAATTPAEPAGAYVAHFPARGSLPRKTGGSASALRVSRPARRSLALRPVWSLGCPRRPVSPKCFRLCRYLHRPLRLLPAGATVAGRDSHPLRDGAFPRHTVSTALGRYGNGRDRGPAANASEVSGALRQPRTVPGRDGSVRRLAALGAPHPGTRSRGPALAGEDGPPIRGRQQERCARRVGDLEGGAAAGRQDGRDQERGTAGDPGAASSVPAACEVSYRADQRAARPVDRVRRGHAARPCRDEAGHCRCSRPCLGASTGDRRRDASRAVGASGLAWTRRSARSSGVSSCGAGPIAPAGALPRSPASGC